MSLLLVLRLVVSLLLVFRLVVSLLLVLRLVVSLLLVLRFVVSLLLVFRLVVSLRLVLRLVVSLLLVLRLVVSLLLVLRLVVSSLLVPLVLSELSAALPSVPFSLFSESAARSDDKFFVSPVLPEDAPELLCETEEVFEDVFFVFEEPSFLSVFFEDELSDELGAFS